MANKLELFFVQIKLMTNAFYNAMCSINGQYQVVYPEVVGCFFYPSFK